MAPRRPAERYLPEELIEEILARLPPKSLMRFKCVQKSWVALIESPRFMAAHFRLFTLNKRNAVALLKGPHSISLPPKRTLHVPSNQFHFGVKPSCLQLVGTPIYGIICVCDDLTRRVALWNPTIQQLRVIPRVVFSLPRGAKVYYYDYGFGCDPSTHDYKVIAIGSYFLHGNHGPIHGFVASVYPLSIDTWRNIDSHLSVGVEHKPTCHVFFNGTCHWLARRGNTRLLLSLHMSTEVFETTPLPNESNDGRLDACLLELKESIGVVVSTSWGDMDKGFEIWDLSVIGVKESWTKVISIGSFPGLGIRSALGYGTNYGCFFVKKNSRVMWYNAREGSMRTFRIRGSKIVSYVESFVSVC